MFWHLLASFAAVEIYADLFTDRSYAIFANNAQAQIAILSIMVFGLIPMGPPRKAAAFFLMLWCCYVAATDWSKTVSEYNSAAVGFGLLTWAIWAVGKTSAVQGVYKASYKAWLSRLARLRAWWGQCRNR